MAEPVSGIPPTLAQLPFFVSGRFPRPDLLGRCEADRIVYTSGREFLERVRDLGLGLQSLGMAAGTASCCSRKAVPTGCSRTLRF